MSNVAAIVLAFVLALLIGCSPAPDSVGGASLTLSQSDAAPSTADVATSSVHDAGAPDVATSETATTQDAGQDGGAPDVITIVDAGTDPDAPCVPKSRASVCTSGAGVAEDGCGGFYDCQPIATCWDQLTTCSSFGGRACCGDVSDAGFASTCAPSKTAARITPPPSRAPS